MAELKITAANFENEVLRSDKPVLLDFYAAVAGGYTRVQDTGYTHNAHRRLHGK